jgi:hypothetical protein
MTNEEIREQIQENIISYIDSKVFLANTEQFKDDLCQIVVDCFAEDKKKNDSAKYYNHPEEVYNRAWMDSNSKL